MTHLYHFRPQLWPQLSLRSFFLLMTLAGCALGWIEMQVKWNRARAAVLDEIVLGEFVSEGCNPPFGIRILGGRGVRSIAIVRALVPRPDSRLHELAALFPEAEIDTIGPDRLP